MTDNERNLMVRTAVVVGQIISMGGVHPEMLKAFTEAMKVMEDELAKNNEKQQSHLLKSVIPENETKQ